MPWGIAPVDLQRVTEAEYQILSQDLRITEEPANPATGAWTRVAEDAEDLVEPEPGVVTVTVVPSPSRRAATRRRPSAPGTRR